MAYPDHIQSLIDTVRRDFPMTRIVPEVVQCDTETGHALFRVHIEQAEWVPDGGGPGVGLTVVTEVATAWGAASRPVPPTNGKVRSPEEEDELKVDVAFIEEAENQALERALLLFLGERRDAELSRQMAERERNVVHAKPLDEGPEA